MRSRIRDDEGASAVVVAVLIVVLLAFAALVVDAGALYAHRRQVQTAADAAALAGVQALPVDPDTARLIAADYAARNAADASDVAFTVGSTWATNDTLTAELLDPDMGLFFARFMGYSDAPVAASATAMVGSPRTYGSGLMPFGIVAAGTAAAPYGYTPGVDIPLVVDTGDQSQGNWHYVDLTPFTDGASSTKQVIGAGGTTDPVSIGDVLSTQPGSPNNPNFKELSKYLEITCAPHGVDALVYDQARGTYEPTHASDDTHCNRLITCPVIVVAAGDPYDWDGTAGASVKVQVVGFLNMFISNDPNFKDGALMSTFVQTVPVSTFTPGGYIPYGGVMTWLQR